MALAVAALLVLSLGGYATYTVQKRGGRMSRGETRAPRADGPVTESSLRASEGGRKILAYLLCTDFDCEDALRGVVALGPDAVPLLVRLLRQDAPPAIAPDLPQDKLSLLTRTRVMRALGALRDARAFEPLAARLRDPAPQVRAGAAEAIGEIGGGGALDHLVPLLRDDDEFVRETTARALGRLKKAGALGALREAAAAEAKPHVRRAMEEAIRGIEQP